MAALKTKRNGLNKKKKIVVIGGGTGTFTVLSGLKKYPDLDLTAIVTMADDGGSTGILRDEFGVLPPGDLRQCLVALSEESDVLRQLFNHRYDRGTLEGHNFGNIFISTLEQVTGNLDSALDFVGEILKIRGKVLPVTLNKIRLVTKLKNGKILNSEHELSSYQLISRFGIQEMKLTPRAKINKKAAAAIQDADLVVIGPGNLYASLIPNFLVEGVSAALRTSKAKKVYVANLMNKHGHTDDFTVAHYIAALEQYIGNVITTVIHNTKLPPKALVRRYSEEGTPVPIAHGISKKTFTIVGADVLADTLYAPSKKDPLRRTLIRHDSDKLAKVILEIL